MNAKRKLIALLAIATLVSIVNASVFVYYPITLTISPQEPPVVFRGGSNANGTDLRGKTISVYIENKGTSLKIQVHPTLQRNYYKGVAEIENLDSNTYYIKFNVVSSIASNSGVNTAYLIVGNYKIDLKSSGVQPANEWIELSASGKLTVNLYLELSSIGSSSIDVSVDLIITTQTSETPPTTPP